jgi:universal stress protein E
VFAPMTVPVRRGNLYLIAKHLGAGMRSIRRILVAIRDLHHPPRTELRKAAELARAAKARVELFHAVDIPIRTDPTVAATGKAHALQRVRAADHRLHQFARLALLRGIEVSCHSNSDYPPHEAIVRRAVETRADVVVAATRARGFAGRLLLRNTDWELIRQCPCPLLLVKSTRPYAKSVMLAAVDPFHTHAKPADLDVRLLSLGNSLSRLFKGSLHIFHAYMPLVNVASTPGAAAIPIAAAPELEVAHAELVASELDRLAKSAGVPTRAQHLHMGVVASELCAAARSTRATLAIMGAVSRSALRRIFIGSTAEDALDKLGCDVLVVKPRGFKSNVRSRPMAVAAAARTG